MEKRGLFSVGYKTTYNATKTARVHQTIPVTDKFQRSTGGKAVSIAEQSMTAVKRDLINLTDIDYTALVNSGKVAGAQTNRVVKHAYVPLGDSKVVMVHREDAVNTNEGWNIKAGLDADSARFVLRYYKLGNAKHARAKTKTIYNAVGVNVNKEHFKMWRDDFGPIRSYTCTCGNKTNKFGNGKCSVCGNSLEVKITAVYELNLSNVLWLQSGKEVIRRDGVRIFKA